MKKTIQFIFLILTLSSFFVAEVVAEDLQIFSPKDLFTVIEKSIPESRAAQLERESTLAAVRQSSLRSNPEIEMFLGSRSIDSGPSDDGGPSFQIGISQELDFWEVRQARSKVLEKEADLPAIQAARIVRERFFEVAALITEKAVIENRALEFSKDLADGKKLVKLLSAQSQSNTLRKAEIDLIASEYLFLEVVIKTLEQKSISLSFSIKSLLGGQNIKLRPTIIFPQTLPATKDLLVEALDSSTDLKSLGIQQAIAAADLELAKRERNPNIKAGPYYQEEHGGDIERTFGLQVSLPLPIWSDNSAAIEAGRKNLEKTDSQQTALKITLERQIEVLRSAYLTEVHNLYSTVKQLRKNSESLYNKQLYLAAQGAIPLTLILSSHKQYLDARKTEFEAIESTSRAFFALAEKLQPYALWELGAGK